ncbi:MAG: MotA/TolQ/ExbB proton channel family protein [Pseudomonadota bacterium]|nr:MotA/TolQ/ExbB proton channel family protein [Pseudomonadota bacterium]
MFEIIKAGGWVMAPIITCSILAFAIIVERLWSLQTQRVMPKHLVARVWQLRQQGKLTPNYILTLRDGSPLGRILAAGLASLHQDRQVMKENVEETGRCVAHELERFLNTLGTIASIAPLLGLLGTVIGIMRIFSDITEAGVGDPQQLAGGISVALVTTVAGLIVAIPSLFFYRYLRGRVDDLVINMEAEALKLIGIMRGDRRHTLESIKGDAA